MVPSSPSTGPSNPSHLCAPSSVGDRLSPSAELQDTLLLAAMTSTLILLAVLGSILAIEPNFEDIHEAADQPEGEVGPMSVSLV